MPKRKYFLGIFIILTVAFAGYTVDPFSKGTKALIPPTIDCVHEIDLGEREQGELAISRFTIKNDGDEVLVIGSVETNCACAGIEIEDNGTPISFDRLLIEPHQTKQFMTRLSVRGQPGEPIHQNIRFQTNDPIRPTVEIIIVVPKVRGISCQPNSVVCGEVSVGEKIIRQINISELGTDETIIERITATPNSFLTATFRQTDTPISQTRKGWHAIGIIDIQIKGTVVRLRCKTS